MVNYRSTVEHISGISDIYFVTSLNFRKGDVDFSIEKQFV